VLKDKKIVDFNLTNAYTCIQEVELHICAYCLSYRSIEKHFNSI